MKHRLKIALTAAILVTIVLGKAGVAAAIYFYPPIIGSQESHISAKEIIKLTNDYRLGQGLSELKENPRLDQAAVNKARDILAQNYFDHTSPEGKKFSDWVKEVNYKYFYVGENLAIDFDTAKETFDAWLNSPEHKENIIKTQYQEIGVAAIEGKFQKRPTVVVVQLFGSRVLGATSIDENYSGSSPAAIGNYFYSEPWWQKVFSLERLDKIDRILNYLLILTLIVLFFSYRIRKINQANTAKPNTRRYQAKTFSE